MRLNLAPIIEHAEKLLAAIEVKSWHHAVNAAQACLEAMPSPAWMETEPGMASYSPFEGEANRWLNILRTNVCGWMGQLVNPDRSWEASDKWPEPNGLRLAMENLKGFVVQEVECLPRD